MGDSSDDVWADDRLDRRGEGEFLATFIKARHEDARSQDAKFSLVLNIDADWGYGKSFLVERLGRQLAGEGHIVARVDAWSSDFAADPLLPVMAAIEAALKPYLGDRKTKERWLAAKENAGAILLATAGGVLRGAVNRFVPGATEAISEIIDTDVSNVAASVVGDGLAEGARKAIDGVLDRFARQSLAEHQLTADSIEAFRRDLGAVLEVAEEANVPMPMIIIVDELDRCRPSYAVAMLERIKHLFQIPDVAFLVATNTSQLQHSIGAVYGAGFDSTRYLHRFFDMTYSLAEPARSDFVANLLTAYPRLATVQAMPGTNVFEYLVETFRAFDMSARDMQQCLGLLNNVLSTWPRDIRPIIPVLIPLACAHQLRLGGETLAEVARQLEKRIKVRDWSVESFVGSDGRLPQKTGVMTVLNHTVGMLKQGFAALNRGDDPAIGTIDAWIIDRLFDGARARQFDVNSYGRRLRQVGRLVTVTG